MGQPRDQTAREVKEQKAQMAKLIFDIVPEDEQKQHVAPQMGQTAMQEHGGQEPGVTKAFADHGRDQGIDAVKGKQRALVGEEVPVAEENADIHQDQRPGDIGLAPGRVVVADRKHTRIGSGFVREGKAAAKVARG
jgi:hypothetical protein